MRITKKTICLAFIATLFLAPGIFSGTLISPISSTHEAAYDSNQPDMTIGDSSVDDSRFVISAIPTSTTGTGSMLNVIEYASGTFPSRTANANESTTFYSQTFDIPLGWHTTSVTAISSSMYHLRDWVQNGDFSSITGWFQNEDDNPGVLTENYDGINDWITIVRTSGGKVKYDYWGSWNQSIVVNEGGTASATLNVTYKIDTTTGTNGQNAQPYLYVNGTIWELPTGGERFSVSQDWQTYSLDLPLALYSFPGTLDVALGIQGFDETQFQTTGTLTCDDVILTLRTSRLSEVTDLRARDTNNATNLVTFTTGVGGKGYAALNGNWTGNVELEFMANETGTEFGLELLMLLKKNTKLATNTYTVANATDVSWSSEFTAREMAYPFTYEYFNVTIPDDWTLITVYDAYDDLQLSGVTYYNATFYPSSSILVCDVNGTGVSGTPHYGTWSFFSTSPNYGDSLTFWSDSGSSWIESSTLYPGSLLRVNATFSDSLNNPPSTAGMGSLIFYDVEELQMYTESGGSLDINGLTTYQNGTNPSNITIQSSWLAGPVVAISTWSNGTSVAEIRKQFAINHHTELEIEFPVYQAFRGDTISVRVKYVDSETGLGIAGASLYFNWTFGSDIMGYAGSGWYAGFVDTSQATIGAYLVTTNASKLYNDFATTTSITIEIQERTVLYSPKDLGVPTTDYDIAWGNSKTIYIAYEDSIAMNPTSLTALTGTPPNPVETDTFTSNNVYSEVSSVGNAISLIVETNASLYDFISSDLTTLTFKLEGKFSVSVSYGEVFAYNYTSGSWVSIIDSYSPIIDTTLSWKANTPTDFISGTGQVRARIDATHASAFDYEIDLFDFIAYQPITDLAPAVSVTSNWPAQTVVGTQIGPIFNSTLNIWQVTYNTADVTPGDYTILIEASATGHQSKSLELSVVVRSHHSRVTASPPSETPWSWKTNVSFSFSDTDNSSLIISESNISSIVVDSTYGSQYFDSGNWTYNSGSGQATLYFWLDTSSWSVGSQSVTITVITTGSGLSKFFDDGSTVVEIVIRAHDISVSVSPPGETPWSWKTNVSVTLTDLDNSSLPVTPQNVSQIIIAGQTFTSADWTYSAGEFFFFLDTSDWGLSSVSYGVSVVTTTSPRHYNDGSGTVRITVRSHILIASASTLSATPWSWMTDVGVTLSDLDNSSLPVTPGNVTQIEIDGQIFTSVDWVYSAGVFTVQVDTSAWTIGTGQYSVSVTTSAAPKFYDDGDTTASIEIRAHYIGVSVSPPSAIPWSWTTDIQVTLTDLDNASLLINEANVTQITIDGNTFTFADWTYAAGTFSFVLDTSGWSIGSNIYTVSVSTAAAPKTHFDGEGSVTIEIRQHLLGLLINPPASTPWSWTTNVVVTITDLDNSSLPVSQANISQIVISGVIFTSSNWSYSSSTFTCILDTSNWNIGSGTYDVDVITNAAPTKFYGDSSSSVLIRIVSHTTAVEVVRPAATPWSENTTVVIRIFDGSNASLIVQSSNVTQIQIGVQVFTSSDWVWDDGNFTVIVDADNWPIGSASYSVIVTTSGAGATKYFTDTSTSVVIEIRNRYSEAYSPSPDPVPFLDNLTVYVEFRDRDAFSALVDLTKIYLNGSDLTEGVDYWVVRISEGYYQVSMITSSLSIGNHEVLLTCEQANYENATTTVRFRIRLTETEAVSSGYRFNVPLGTNITFTIEFNDIDHSQGIPGALLVNNGTFGWSYAYLGNGVYEVEIETLDSTAVAEYTIRFNFTKASFEDAYVIIIIDVETHSTFLSFDEPVLPTGIGSNITVYLFYEDISTDTGISNSTNNISVYLTDDIIGSPSFTIQDNIALGVGHYLILVPADQFGGLYNVNITVFFNWTGVSKYANLTRSFSVQLQGTQTDVSVYIAPQAIYFGDWINFTLYYENTESGTGVSNATNNVWGSASVTTGGQAIDPSDFQITWISGGYYQFLLDSSLFTSDGSFAIKTHLNWTPSASPYYENQTLSITVTILVRTTLLDVVPPQNTAFDENATFTFTYYDSPSNSFIANSTQMNVQLDNVGIEYWLSYEGGTGVWTVIVNTTSIGSIGPISLILNVTWGGAPFYQNQTKSVSLTVIARPTQLSYTPPTPTFFNSNVTIIFTYKDLLDDSSLNMFGSTLVLSTAGPILAGNYTVIDNGDGTYTVNLNTTAFLQPGTYTIDASMTYIGARFGSDANVQFNLQVLNRAILVTAEPVGNTAWLQNIEVTLHVTDGETAALVSNATGHVRINVASQNATNPDILGLATVWSTGTDTYSVSIANSLAIGTYVLFMNVSYDFGAPYYGYRVVQLTVSIRKHSTELQLSEPAIRTGFGLNTTFQLYYLDLDTDLPIDLADLSVDNVSLSGYWSIVPIAGNLYEVRINTTAFSAVGTYWVSISTLNVGPLANYADASILVRVYVRERYTLLQYDPVGTFGYTENVTITVYYSDSDLGNIGITNDTFALSLWVNQTTYYVLNGPEPGAFIIEMPADQFVAFQSTAVIINMTWFGTPFYQNQSIQVSLQISGTSTEFAWDPSNPVPFGNQANVTFFWGDIDSVVPVACTLGVDVQITVVSVTQPSLDTNDPAIVLVVQGADVGAYATFFLLINTSYLDTYQTYEFRITIDWINPNQAPYYEDQVDRLVSLVVRRRDTAIPQAQADPVAYGENATIRLQYVDLDNNSLLITGGALDISVLDGLTYTFYTTPVAGSYEIEIVTAGTDLYGTVHINVTVLWYGKPFFENQTVVSVILTVIPRAALIEVNYPAATPYLDNVSFTITLQDSHSMEYINNNASFISAELLSPVSTSVSITYVLLSDGEYEITFNTTIISQIGTYVLRITFDHTIASPYYALLARNVTGTVRERATNLDYDPASDTPYGNDMVFNLTFTDVDESPAEGISSASIYVSCATSNDVLTFGVNYWFTYMGNGIYLINISSVALGEPSDYILQIEANSTADWWLDDRTRSVTVTVAFRSVEMITISPDSTYYDDVSFFTITLTDLDNGTGVGLEGMTSYISVTFIVPGSVSGSANIVEIGNGVYNITIDTDILDQLTDYQVSVEFNPPYSPYYWESPGARLVTGRISARPTQLIYDIEGATPYLDNVTVTLTYEDAITLAGISSASLTVSCITAAQALVEGSNYWISDLGGGTYTLLVDSTALGDVDAFSLDIQAEYSGEPFYQNRSISATAQVRERATRLTFTPPSETPFGDNITIVLKLYDVDAGLSPITTAQSNFALDSVNSSPVNPSYYEFLHISGETYWLVFNTSVLDIFGHYNFTISVTGMVASNYEDQTIWLEADVRSRNTQLTIAPIAQTGYTENVTVVLYYTDRDASIGVTNGTNGVLVTLNTSSDWWIQETALGQFTLLINATDLGSTGEFAFLATFDWINGKPFYANRSIEFTVSVTGAGAVLTYVPPPHIPIGDNITITLEYRDSATGNGISNGTGNVHITITHLNSTVVGPFQYIVEVQAPGVYVFHINSTPFWTTGNLFFEFDVIWTQTELPYYPSVNDTLIRAVIRGINTQALADAPYPGTVPSGDLVFVNVTYIDLDHDFNIFGATIVSDWTYGWSFEILPDGKFNVTLQTTGISTTGRINAVFTFNKTFYTTRSVTVSITIRLASTSSTATAPQPPIVPIGDNVTLEVTFFDTDHQVNITDGDIQTDWANGWSWTRVLGGGFRVTLFTVGVTNLIEYTVSFTVNKTGYTDGLANMKFEVRAIRTAISATPPGTVVAGSNITVVVTYEDLDHNTGIEGASISTNAPGGTYSWVELANGQYEITYYLWQELAGTYTYDITGTFADHDPASINIDLNLRQVRTELTTPIAIILANWSDSCLVDVAYDNLDLGGLVTGATVKATLSGVEYFLVADNDSYNITIDSSDVNVGTYIITIEANRTNFESRILQITLVVVVLQTDLYSDDGQYTFSVSSGELVDITVFYEELASKSGVIGATVAYSWDFGTGQLLSNGTAGFYTAAINTTGADLNIYTFYVRANKSNHAEASIYFSFDVGLIDTQIRTIGSATLQVVYGETVQLLVNYTAVDFFVGVTGATVGFKFTDSNYSGSLNEISLGIYNATIETAQLYAGSFSMYVVALKPGFDTGTLLVLLEVARIDTILTSDSVSLTATFTETVSINFTFYDTHNNVPIENALLEYSWSGFSGSLVEVGNGTYRLDLDTSLAPADVYRIIVSATKSNYVIGRNEVTLEVQPIPTTVNVLNFIRIPVGDAETIEIQLFDTFSNVSITGATTTIIGGFGSVHLNESGNGNYTFTVPNNVDIGSYDVTFIFSKGNYSRATADVTVIVHRIETSLTTLSTNDFVTVNFAEYVSIEVIYTDINHDVPITGATLSLTQIDNLITEGEYTVTESSTPGMYIISFLVMEQNEFSVTIHAQRGSNYE
ncbi:MAG: hypothetical protein ACW97A_04190, partial [Candidatus Thorarchaeota archaeon]